MVAVMKYEDAPWLKDLMSYTKPNETNDYTGFHADPKTGTQNVGPGISWDSYKGLFPSDVGFTKGKRRPTAKEVDLAYPRAYSAELSKWKGDFNAVPDKIKPAIGDVLYNTSGAMNMPGFSKAVMVGDWKRAADELLWKNPDSKVKVPTAYVGVGKGVRAKKNIQMIEDYARQNDEISSVASDVFNGK